MRCVLFGVILILTPQAAVADQPDMVHLAGTPEQIGTLWGERNREHIRHDVETGYWKRAEAAGISKETLLERSAFSVQIMQEIAPHWLDEARAAARAADVPEELYLAFLDGVVRDRFLHECTSYAVSRDHARDGAILFHKTRDNRDVPQVVSIVESSLEGIYKFISVSDATGIRCSMMVNEKGLAGAADYPAERKKDSSTLHLEPADPQQRGIMAGTILRYIAERASHCVEALAIIQDMVAKGYYAGGNVGGNHWLFVDRDGTILEVCNNARHVVSKVHTQRAYFSRLNNSPAARRLRESDEPVGFDLFRSVSRDPSICFGSSISGMTVEIDPEYPEWFTCAWVTLPVRAAAFPLWMGQQRTPTSLLDGTAYRLGKASPEQHLRWEALERSMHAEKQQLRQEVAASIAAGNPATAHTELLDQWSDTQAQRLVRALQQPDRPNVILIMTDNHGPWTLGCYGNQEIQTPRIDRLAAEGTLFTRCYANNAVCSPTRASFLTGLMPSQHGVHRYLGAKEAQMDPDAYNTLEEFDTLPSLLAQAGYECGLSGKWHLGGNLHPQEGFRFWTTKPHGHSQGFYDQQVIENGEVRVEPTYLTDYWTQRGIEFIQANRDRPFFLFLAYNGPYGLGASMREPIRNRHAETYGELELPGFPRREAHPWNHHYGKWVGDLEVIRKYAAEVSAIDDGVGRVMDTLKRLDLDDNTLVIFTADQGLAGGHSGFWGMGDHTRPLTAFDWTIHIPLIFRQPGRIPAAQRSDLLVSNVDFLPTMLEHLGLEWTNPDQPASPGRSFASVLAGRPIEAWDNTVFYEFENVRAIRTDRWKYIERFRQAPNELYNLARDPEELENLIDRPELQEVQNGLKRQLHEYFDRVADPRWDLWKGGTSKTGLIMRDLFDNPGPAPPPAVQER
jgi:arylsulfatase A-like enzyme